MGRRFVSFEYFSRVRRLVAVFVRVEDVVSSDCVVKLVLCWSESGQAAATFRRACSAEPQLALQPTASCSQVMASYSYDETGQYFVSLVAGMLLFCPSR